MKLDGLLPKSSRRVVCLGEGAFSYSQGDFEGRFVREAPSPRHSPSSREMAGRGESFNRFDGSALVSAAARSKPALTGTVAWGDKKKLAREYNRSLFLGELILCYTYIVTSARKKGSDLEKEIAFVVVHGLLHLLGFKHGAKMYSLQEEIVKNAL